MAAPYLNDLRDLLDRLPGKPGETLECRHFFSGAAAYAAGRIFMSLSPVGLALKLPAQRCAALIDEGAKPLQYFPAAPVKKDYVILPEMLATDLGILGQLVSEAIAFSRRGVEKGASHDRQ